MKELDNPNKVSSKVLLAKIRRAEHGIATGLSTWGCCILRAIQERSLLVAALVMTFLFYLPALASGSFNAGFLYMGDNMGFYWPSLYKLHALVSNGILGGLDISHFNGGADFFLTPNFFGAHPLFVIYSALTAAETTSFRDIGHLLTVALLLHSFVAMYFTAKVLKDYIGLEAGPSVLAGVLFAFSIYMINNHGEPQFVFCISTIPWITYSSLKLAQKFSVVNVLVAVLPVMLALLGGYLPLGAACIGLSILLTGICIIVAMPASNSVARIKLGIRAATPLVLAAILVLPYIIAAYRFHADSPSNQMPSIFFSAHQLAELPQTIFRLLSFNMQVPGPYFEGSTHWGLVPLLIFAIFISSEKARQSLGRTEGILLVSGLAIYFIILLSIFGKFSVLSDLLFYLVPQIGEMHIYQRFLFAAQIFFAAAVAIMLRAILAVRPDTSAAVVSVSAFLVMMGLAYVVAFHPVAAAKHSLNNYLVFEAMLALIFALSLLTHKRALIYSVAVICCSLPVLDRMYDYSVDHNMFEAQKSRQILALDESRQQEVLQFLFERIDKDVMKYVDLTPMWSDDWVQHFPKSFPYYVLKDATLSSYHGFNFYLSTRSDYMAKMPVQDNLVITPDWAWMQKAGLDFVVAPAAARTMVEDTLGQRFAEANVLALPGGNILMVLERPGSALNADLAYFDNGYFQLAPSTGIRLDNVALGKPVRQSSTLIGSPLVATDGLTEGDFAAGSVTHTDGERSPWLEVDLEVPVTISGLRLWNRSDCCKERLSNFWVLISDAPLAPETSLDSLLASETTWRKYVPAVVGDHTDVTIPDIEGRFVRIQLAADGHQEKYLSVAEIEVLQAVKADGEEALGSVELISFSTNKASRFSLEFQSDEELRLSYLFWPNPRLHYYLDGKEVALDTAGNAPPSLVVAPGQHRFEVTYRNSPLRLFWVVYFAYFVALMIVLIMAILGPRLWRSR